MKKLASMILVCVLLCSFMVGAMNTHAGEHYARNDRATPACVREKEPVCVNVDCRMYYRYLCPWGIVYVWTGEYCPAWAPCWDPNDID